MTLPVVGGESLKENYVGTNFANYDSFLILSHFKGHTIKRMKSRNGLHTLEHAEKIGLGSWTYQLVSIGQEKSGTVERKIKLTVNGQKCIAALYGNPSADNLYNALPLELTGPSKVTQAIIEVYDFWLHQNALREKYANFIDTLAL